MDPETKKIEEEKKALASWNERKIFKKNIITIDKISLKKGKKNRSRLNTSGDH